MPNQPDGDSGEDQDEPRYDPSEDGPEAKLHRAEDEERTRLERLLDKFIASLTLEDRHRHLFTFLEMKQWILMHKRVPKRR